MVNIRDVAKLSCVSTTTVSHVINNTRYVSEELTNRVLKAMEELDYRPNLLARSLRSGRTKTIGLIIPDISNQFFSEISRKIEDRGYENGYSVILCNTDEDDVKERSYLEVLVNKKVDGIIFISAGESQENQQVVNDSNIPIVITDRYSKEIDADIILVDNFTGGYNATNYLIKLGHRNIGCIGGPSALTPSAERVEGYQSALKSADIAVDDSLITSGNFHYQSGEVAMRELLSVSQTLTAVFACNDMMALGAIREIHNIGKRVPEDISIIGFDNIPLSQIAYPTLTTIAQPVDEIAHILINLLIEKIRFKNDSKKTNEKKPESKKIVLNTKLIERDSCRKIREEK